MTLLEMIVPNALKEVDKVAQFGAKKHKGKLQEEGHDTLTQIRINKAFGHLQDYEDNIIEERISETNIDSESKCHILAHSILQECFILESELKKNS